MVGLTSWRSPMAATRPSLASSSSAIQRDLEQNVRDLVVVCHGVTLRAFLMMWCHLSPEWFESEPNPHNAAIRLIEDGRPR